MTHRPSRKLSSLLEEMGMKLPKKSSDPEIKRLTIDSRRAVPGSLFFALPGLHRDGASFIDEAVARGAVAVVAQGARGLGPARVAYVEVEDPRRALAFISRSFFNAPDKKVGLVGITGTNGKTTVAHTLQYLLSHDGLKIGRIGTVSYDLVERVLPSFRTTPESPDLCELLAQMRDFGCDRAVMEVSSHGIDQMRVAGLEFETAIFLNLTRDHLDYHGDMESYYEVKRRLFTGEIGPVPRRAIINIDDPYGARLANDLPSGVELVTFSMSDEYADFHATDVALGPRGSRFLARFSGETELVETSLIGHYNVSNILSALATCCVLGENLKEVIERLSSFDGIPGRMERVCQTEPYVVLVDYAHTADALCNALGMLREVTEGKLLVVFGCGGDRDRGKRLPMTQAVLELADQSWATADNPRNESLDQIFDDMRVAVKEGDAIEFISDRRRAIELAIKAAGPGDCVLIAGKGHESFQEFGDTVVPFDDRKVTEELVAFKKIGGTR